jgi:predicted DNA-binding transcriptional regulator AlpA
MNVQLYSIEQAPVSLPIWHAILEDLADPPVHRVARVLGLSRRTVYRYNQTGQAPRAAILALYWLTRWGRSAVHTQAVNDAALAFAVARQRDDEVARLKMQLGRLESLGSFGSANAPLLTGGLDV